MFTQNKWLTIGGWIPSLLVSAMLVMSASMKLTRSPVAVEGMQVEDVRTGDLRTVIPALSELETARLIINQSLETGISALQVTWKQITKELQAGDVR